MPQEKACSQPRAVSPFLFLPRGERRPFSPTELTHQDKTSLERQITAVSKLSGLRTSPALLWVPFRLS